MNRSFVEVSGSVIAPQGFRASGVFCDIKRLGTGKGSDKGPKRDLALIVSEAPAIVAGTPAAHRDLESRKAAGKLLLKVQ